MSREYSGKTAQMQDCLLKYIFVSVFLQLPVEEDYDLSDIELDDLDKDELWLDVINWTELSLDVINRTEFSLDVINRTDSLLHLQSWLMSIRFKCSWWNVKWNLFLTFC